MSYSAEKIEEIEEHYEKWMERHYELTTRILTRAYRKDSSHTLAAHGLVRRLNTMARCMEQVYRLIPLNATNPPQGDIDDAAIFLQSFVFNTYGAVDNLARIWVRENELTERDGSALRQTWIGLAPGCKIVRESLSKPFQDYLAATDSWFDYLKNYRDALAHRIPLYIPPKIFDEAATAQFHKLEDEMRSARQQRDYDKLDELRCAQGNLGRFVPVMMHSYGPAKDDGSPVRIHPQMICDIGTVVELAEKMMAELEALPEI